eukprot:COSAG02_NODE_18040_length_964_cov_2.627746_1_plen_146_part_00
MRWLSLLLLVVVAAMAVVSTVRGMLVTCELTMGDEEHAVAVGADGNATVAQLAGLAGAKLVKKLRLSSGVVLSDLETLGGVAHARHRVCLNLCLRGFRRVERDAVPLRRLHAPSLLRVRSIRQGLVSAEQILKRTKTLGTVFVNS